MKRQAVLVTGARLFHENGYEHTSLDDIAAALGVTKPSLYYYIKNKEEILYEIISNSLSVTKEAFRKASDEGTTTLNRLLIFFREYAKHLHSDFGSCAASVDVHSLNAQLRKDILEARKKIDAQIRELIARGGSDGSISVGDPRLAANFLFGAFNWIAQWQRSSGRTPEEAVIDEFINLTRRALAPARGRRQPKL
jgi:AcrR family transcriptional regulator